MSMWFSRKKILQLKREEKHRNENESISDDTFSPCVKITPVVTVVF